MTHLNCPFSEKDQAKSLGARWDAMKNKWYIPPGLPLEPFAKWLPNDILERTEEPIQTALTTTHMATYSSHDTSSESAKPMKTHSVSLSDYLKTASTILKRHMSDSTWIRAEVSSFQRNAKGFAAFELVDYSEAGVLLAKTRAFIWSNDADRLIHKFSSTTNTLPSSGIKILVNVRVDIHATGGLSIVITDIDPSYTLGDIEANLKRIRDTLTAEGVFLNNKHLPGPEDFYRVAVISPYAAAGLGDFKRDADLLESYGLCQFDYLSATFQGHQAISSLIDALKRIAENGHYDALCLIRGGGAVSDLYWLNHVELARCICLLKIPVFTGIGHEKDHNIVDEVAHTKFDTPSKVIAFIRATITQNALSAEADFKSICSASERLSALAELRINAEISFIKNTAQAHYSQGDQSLEKDWLLIQHATERQLETAISATEKLFKVIQTATLADLEKMTMLVDQRFNEFVTQAQETVNVADRQMALFFERLSETSLHQVSHLSNDIERLIVDVQYSSLGLIDYALKEVTSLSREILGMGPQATLKRGFAVVRDNAGLIICSASEAQETKYLEIEFKDGRISTYQQFF